MIKNMGPQTQCKLREMQILKKEMQISPAVVSHAWGFAEMQI